jgi:hypothetical protein
VSRSPTRFVTRRVAIAGVAAPLAWGGAGLAAEDATTIDFAKSAIGSSPSDFEFQRTGEGDLGQWTLVRDPSAAGGVAIEHVSTDPRDDRFPLAIYQPIVAENLEVKVRLKIMPAGPSLTAGFAVSLRNPNSYYAISANAFEQRVDLLLFADGRPARVESAEAEVMPDCWHTLGVTLNDDHFKVSFEGKVLFTAFERTRRKDGHIALWTQEDTVTRFDRIDVRVLPPTEWR